MTSSERNIGRGFLGLSIAASAVALAIALSIALAIALTFAPAPVSASPVANKAGDLRVRSFPQVTPSSLSMRNTGGRLAQTQPTGADPRPSPARTVPLGGDFQEEDEDVLDNEQRELEERLRRELRASDTLGQRRDLDEKVILQVSLGIGIDGGQPSGDPLLSGETLDSNSYARLRSYGFGDAVIGTNGLASQSLRSYLATSYRFDRDSNRPSSAIPTVFDGDFGDFVVRSAWVDVEDVFDIPALAPIHFRVGRQYKYLAAIAHFDGISAGYDSNAVRAQAFVGARANPYDLQVDGSGGADGPISGADLRVDVGRLLGRKRAFPIIVAANALRFDGRTHSSGSATFRRGSATLVSAKVRTIGPDVAAESLRLRTRLSAVSTATVEIDNQHSADWVYDLFLVESHRSDDVTEPRRYLDLAPPRPRLRGRLRGGTVLLRNIDLLVSLAGAFEYEPDGETPPDSHRSSYIEAGSAVELRLRRNLRFGTSATGRYFRRRGQRQTTSIPGFADPLPQNTGLSGERTFLEGGAFLRYSLGARLFSAKAEFYGRRFRTRSPFIAKVDEQAVFRSGGRFSVEGWATDNIRVLLAYDLSFASLQTAPELDGIKSLRINAEGTF